MAFALLTLALVGTLAFVATGVSGHLLAHAAFDVKRHFLYALGATTVLVAAHSFILFFLLGTGVQMKELVQARGLDAALRRRLSALKARVFPAATVTLLLVVVNFALGAAAHTRAVPARAHAAWAWATLAACIFTLARAGQALNENSRIIAETTRHAAPHDAA